MKKVNEIIVARNAIKKALKSGDILRDISAMHRVGIESIAEFFPNCPELVGELANCAAKDVYFSR